ncbi:MAG TPA: DUF4383 domain-containing protein [Solirubrobacterales bacterium]
MTRPTTIAPPGILTAERPLAPVQWAAIIGSAVVLVWSVPGLIANPDFSTGDAATSEVVLGVDMNGWHALSGFLVALPGFLAALRAPWSAAFCLAAAASLIATAIWALADTYPLGGLFYFPNGGADAILHLATSALFLAGAATYFAARRGARAG